MHSKIMCHKLEIHIANYIKNNVIDKNSENINMEN